MVEVNLPISKEHLPVGTEQAAVGVEPTTEPLAMNELLTGSEREAAQKEAAESAAAVAGQIESTPALVSDFANPVVGEVGPAAILNGKGAVTQEPDGKLSTILESVVSRFGKVA